MPHLARRLCRAWQSMPVSYQQSSGDVPATPHGAELYSALPFHGMAFHGLSLHTQSFPAVSLLAVLLTAALAWTFPVAAQGQAAAGQADETPPTIIVAEGEQFTPQGKGWNVTHQNDSYGSHTYGGMWVTHGGGLGAPADSVGAVAVQKVQIPKAGKYRVWSKYQAPPYFQYLHKIEIVQNGQSLFSHIYGKAGTPRLWSFSGTSDELWWPWGVDHDAAEAPQALVKLAAGPAEIRLSTVEPAQPAGDRFIDFVLLTTNPESTYDGYQPYRIATPFALEALAATRLYLRFENTSDQPAKLSITRAGHFQPQYGSATTQIPEADVPPGQWSAWTNIGPFCRLVHDEGLWLKLPGAQGRFRVQVARDAQGREVVGDVALESGESIVVPLAITWDDQARVRSSRELAEQLTAAAAGWPKAHPKKPEEILFFGAFRGQEPWIPRLKDALGFNTDLPEGYEKTPWEGLHSHLHNEQQIRAFAEKRSDTSTLRFVSFGDEISLGRINFNDPANLEKYRAWLKQRGVTEKELGGPIDQAQLLAEGDAREVWFSNLFNEEQRFGSFRERTQLVEQLLGKHVRTGANYSPHHLALCYGPVFQWVDIFKHRGMSMPWAEDYIFSVPEVPQILSWMFAQLRCGAKYHDLPIHFYVMPHAPGQRADYLRRNVLAAVGYGAKHIDHFWVAPAENFTENYVAWGYHDTFRTLHDAIYQTAAVEHLAASGKVRPGKVAIVLSKATDFNESRLMVDKAQDPFASRCANAPEKLQQIICRKDQQMLYLALRQAQYTVDLLTEDDIAEGDALNGYRAVYFAGEWIDRRIIPKLHDWVRQGGILYATAGAGHRNQFNEAEPAMLELLGLKAVDTQKNVAVLRTLLELPLLEPIDTIHWQGQQIAAIGMKQRLTPGDAQVLATWSDGSAAVTLRKLGQGQVFTIGTLAGNTWMRTGVKPVPFARGGRKNLYNPIQFDPASQRLVRLAVEAAAFEPQAACNRQGVEATLIDHADGTLATLINWGHEPAEQVVVRVRVPFRPRQVRSIATGQQLPVEYRDGVVQFTLDIADADYVLLLK